MHACILLFAKRIRIIVVQNRYPSYIILLSAKRNPFFRYVGFDCLLPIAQRFFWGTRFSHDGTAVCSGQRSYQFL